MISCKSPASDFAPLFHGPRLLSCLAPHPAFLSARCSVSHSLPPALRIGTPTRLLSLLPFSFSLITLYNFALVLTARSLRTAYFVHRACFARAAAQRAVGPAGAAHLNGRVPIVLLNHESSSGIAT